MEEKKETAHGVEVQEQLESNEISLNEARKKFGLSPISDGDVLYQILP